jgi:hypothetical protein
MYSLFIIPCAETEKGKVKKEREKRDNRKNDHLS